MQTINAAQVSLNPPQILQWRHLIPLIHSPPCFSQKISCRWREMLTRLQNIMFEYCKLKRPFLPCRRHYRVTLGIFHSYFHTTWDTYCCNKRLCTLRGMWFRQNIC